MKKIRAFALSTTTPILTVPARDVADRAKMFSHGNQHRSSADRLATPNSGRQML